MTPTQRLLREYVQEVLNEDDGGDYGGLTGGEGGSGGSGNPYGSGKDLYNAFVKPFVNVFQTAAGKAKELSVSTQTLAKTAYEVLATSLVPFLQDDYERIFADEKRNIDKVRKEYSKVYQDTWDAFKSSDLCVAAFLYRPDVFLTAGFAKTAPKAAAKLLSVLSGGKLNKALQKYKLLAGTTDVKMKWSTPVDWSGPMEGVIHEAGEPPIVKFVNDERVKKILADSQVVKQMMSAGQELVHGTLKNVYREASGVLGAKSVEDLQSKIGKKLPGMDKLNAVPEQERPAAEQALLTATKASLKQFYAKSLQLQVDKAVKQGVPQDHPFVAVYTKVIEKIKAL